MVDLRRWSLREVLLYLNIKVCLCIVVTTKSCAVISYLLAPVCDGMVSWRDNGDREVKSALMPETCRLSV